MSEEEKVQQRLEEFIDERMAMQHILYTADYSTMFPQKMRSKKDEIKKDFKKQFEERRRS